MIISMDEKKTGAYELCKECLLLNPTTEPAFSGFCSFRLLLVPNFSINTVHINGFLGLFRVALRSICLS